MTPPSDYEAIVTGGPLGCSDYKLAQFHYHWGRVSGATGSEHYIEGMQ